MTDQDIKFIQDNIINFESVALGYVRNIDHAVLNEYHRIYQSSLDPSYVLNAWCGGCVFDMLKRLKHHYENVISAKQAEAQIQTNQTNQTNDKIKASNSRGRKSK
jgi:hypothetical protein